MGVCDFHPLKPKREGLPKAADYGSHTVGRPHLRLLPGAVHTLPRRGTDGKAPASFHSLVSGAVGRDAAHVRAGACEEERNGFTVRTLHRYGLQACRGA